MLINCVLSPGVSQCLSSLEAPALLSDTDCCVNRRSEDNQVSRSVSFQSQDTNDCRNIVPGGPHNIAPGQHSTTRDIDIVDNDIDIVVDIDIDVVVEDGNICIFGHRLISVSSRLVTSGVEPSSSLALHRRLYNCGHLLSLTDGQLSTIRI